MIKKLFIITIALLCGYSYSQTTHEINSPDEIEDVIKNIGLEPGDIIVLKDGTYSMDDSLEIYGEGTAEQPITFRPQSPGGVVFTGTMKMRVSGEYFVIDGFHWKEGFGTNNLIEFRAKDLSGVEQLAQNCTIQNCVIDGLKLASGEITATSIAKHRWIILYGNNNNVLNCSLMNKESAGVMVLVELRINDPCIAANHTISNNFFFNFNKINSDLSNSGDSETIRVGSSAQQNFNSATTVSNNYFLQADGENEIISNKSANNIYVNNTFRRSRGSLVLRHGPGATVEKNYFLGENVDGTGGLRIVDSDHVITNNYIQDCITVLEQAKWNNGITFMGGSAPSVTDCNASTSNNGYQESFNNIISNNTIINTNAPLFYNGDKGTSDNLGTVADNLIFFNEDNANLSPVFSEDDPGDYDAFGVTLTYTGNVFDGVSLGENNDGFSEENISLTQDGEIFSHDQEGKGADMGGFSPHTDDMVGNGIGACFLDVNGDLIIDPDCEIVELPKLKVAEIPNLDINEGRQSVTVEANVAWTASTTLNWLTINPDSGTGEGNDIISIDYETNPSDTPRSGVITFNQVGGDLNATLNVTQSGAEVNLSEVPQFIANGEDLTLGVDANVVWEAVVGIDWITLSETSGSGKGGSIMITADENPSAAERSGIITFNQVGGDVSTELIVSQAAQNAEDLFNLINDLGLDDLVEIHDFSKQQVGDDNGTNRTNFAANTLDKDSSTRWAADDDDVPAGELKADGEYIIYDLGAIYDLDVIRLRTDGKDDAYGYQLLVSESDANESDFTKLIPVSEDIILSEAGSSEFQQHEVTVSARYVKLLGFGRFDADITERKSPWTNITEIEFFGTSDDPASDDDFVLSGTLIYPVPADSNIAIENYEDLTKVEILSLDGRLLTTKSFDGFNSSVEVETTSLANGVYLLKLSNSSGVAGTKRIVIQH